MENTKDKMRCNIKDNIIKVVETAKKIYKCRIIVRLGVKGYNAAYKVYSLVPKYDKITGINTDKFVADHIRKHDINSEVEESRRIEAYIKEHSI